MKTFNMNDQVEIKLSKNGIKKLRARHRWLYKQIPFIGEFTPPATDADGFCKMQLWEVMNIFGPCCSNDPNVILRTIKRRIKFKNFNIDSDIWVKLTDLGIQKLKERHNEIYKRDPSIGEFTPPSTDVFHQMRFWEVMNIFGPCLSNGSEVPFETDILVDNSAFE